MIRSILLVILLTGCVGPAPTISRPENLTINCTAACDFSIPMNNDIVTAKATNFYDFLIRGSGDLLSALPVVGMIVTQWKSLDVMENIIDRFGNQGGSPSSVVNNTTSTVTGDTITSGDIISTETDSSGSGNTTSGDVATSGDTTTGDTDSGNITGGPGDINTGPGYISKPVTTNTTTYSNAYNSDAGYCNGNGCFAPTPPPAP